MRARIQNDAFMRIFIFLGSGEYEWDEWLTCALSFWLNSYIQDIFFSLPSQSTSWGSAVCVGVHGEWLWVRVSNVNVIGQILSDFFWQNGNNRWNIVHWHFNSVGKVNRFFGSHLKQQTVQTHSKLGKVPDKSSHRNAINNHFWGDWLRQQAALKLGPWKTMPLSRYHPFENRFVNVDSTNYGNAPFTPFKMAQLRRTIPNDKIIYWNIKQSIKESSFGIYVSVSWN